MRGNRLGAGSIPNRRKKYVAARVRFERTYNKSIIPVASMTRAHTGNVSRPK